jgi:glycogen operon protein
MTLSWRGLDQPAYYRLDGQGRDVDVTGCGNTVNLTSPTAIRMVLDSLRYWVTQCHVDGFRFDLAVALARGKDEGYDPDHPFLVALRTDPVLSRVKLIAEPWDLGPHGWRTGQFPPPFSEWNDRFRDAARTYWRRDLAMSTAGDTGHGVRDLATRLAGSQDLFGFGDRGTIASVNFVTAHDGFTLADLTRYDHKHNLANGEDNRDGTDNNRSWNHGVEGPTSDPAVLRLRRRSIRNLMGTLLLATGVPMIVAGDEFGNGQGGNNNPYCQDNEVTWLDWRLHPWQQDLQATVRHLLALRASHPVLRQDRFFAGRPVHADGTKDIAWFSPDGAEMDHDRWHDGRLRTLQMYLHAVVPGPDGRHRDESLLVVMQGNPTVVDVVLPAEPWAGGYRLLWDSAQERPPAGDGAVLAPESKVPIVGLSVRVYGVVPVAHR